MKIAFLNKYQNKVNRGAETFVTELSTRLKKNHQVDVITNVNYFNLLKSPYDLIIPTNGRFQAFATRLVTWLTGGKMVISGQSGVGLDDRLNLYSFPDMFVALSTYALNKSKERNPFVKSIYIPNGVDLNKFKPASYKNKKDAKTVLSVGAFTEQKRHELVIKAVSNLNNVNLIIVGGGGDLKQQISDLGYKTLGKDRFELLQVDHDKMPEIFNRSDVFTLASKPYESFGIVLVEALASNIPIVATDDPIRKEIVGDAGLFVDPTNTDKYAKAIEKALKTNWGDEPRKQAEKFDWDKIALEYEKIFKEL